ncbi:hypothetical protein DPMN_086272 [Dreissena polymorpha]|uniref:Uncharacterized protein n=1 Tax=Dreissena polymorpha TaxID=45954 RepID=A0A9D4QUF1_DREPO|nr:hypothetical protein DPMN_086272 [Dreissena polymorpha]
MFKNMTSRVFTSGNYLTLGGHVFVSIRTIFELNHHIQKTNPLTKFHEDWGKNRSKPISNATVVSIKNVLTKFHEDWTKNVTSLNIAPPPCELDLENCVTSIVFTMKTGPPTGGHLHEDWASYVTSSVFELIRGIIGTNILTKIHEYQTRNVAFRLFTRQNVDEKRRTDDARQTKGDPKSSA